MSDSNGGSRTLTHAGSHRNLESVQRLELRVVEGPDAGLRWRSEGSTATIGQGTSCDLVLTDPTVSRFHCELQVSDDGVRVVDSGSHNGTLIEGVRVADGFLDGGALLRLGRTVLRFEYADDDVHLPASSSSRFELLAAQSVAMRRVFAVLERVAPTNSTVLFSGETGTGKSAAARSVHLASERADKPFVTVDCGALPPNLLESELFGHEKGAFTGADQRRLGAFEEANGGTLFLDEIGELPIDLQPKLLGALENRELRRLGGTGSTAFDVRVVAATNLDLRGAVNDGSFRLDLYYRLAVVRVELPPLRARGDDIEVLALHLLEDLAEDQAAIERLMTERFRNRLRCASWAGNVRELRNYLERCLIFDQPVEIEDTALAADDALFDPNKSFADAKLQAMTRFERAYLTASLGANEGVVSRAATSAGLDRTHFYRLLRKHRLGRDR